MVKNLGKKILVTEDEIGLRRALVAELKGAGFQVIEAKDGQVGLDKARSEKPDLMLLDLIMPKMDGKQVVKEIQKTDWGKALPIIFLTNVADPIKVAEINEAANSNSTLFDYLIKTDWELEEIVQKVKDKLGI